MFSKDQCLENIYALAREKGVKIGDLEDKAGISRGYLSRLNKSGGAAPGIETVVSIAEQLGVTVDFLLYHKTGALSPDEKIIAEFVDTLLGNTIFGKTEWSRDAYDTLTKYAYSEFVVDHPLCEMVIDADDSYGGHWIYESVFASQFDPKAELQGDSYHAALDRFSTLYLIPVKSSEFEYQGLTFFELYLFSDKKVQPLCSTRFLEGEVADKIEKLYNTVTAIYAHLGVDATAKRIMSSFIKSAKASQEKGKGTD